MLRPFPQNMSQVGLYYTICWGNIRNNYIYMYMYSLVGKDGVFLICDDGLIVLLLDGQDNR